MTGLRENAAPFAPVKRKTGLNGVENLIKELLEAYDNIVGVFGGNSNVANTINERVGIGVFEKEYWSTTRRVWGVPVNGVLKQTADYQSVLSMDNINTLFKTGLYVKNNNYQVKLMRVPFTDEGFNELIQNNYMIYEPTGESVEIANIVWKDRDYAAELVVLIPDESAFNTKVTIL